MRHTITVKELADYLDQEKWSRFASSCNEFSLKMLEYSNSGKFRVTDKNKVTYEGDSEVAAVAAYNDAR